MPIYKFVGWQFYSCGISENRRRDCTWTYNKYPFFAVSLYTSLSFSLLYLKRIASGLVQITFRAIRPCTGRKVTTFLYFCSLSVSFDRPSDFVSLYICTSYIAAVLKSARPRSSAIRTLLEAYLSPTETRHCRRRCYCEDFLVCILGIFVRIVLGLYFITRTSLNICLYQLITAQ